MRQFKDINDCRQFVCEDFRRMIEYCARFYGYEPPDIHYQIGNWLQSGIPVNRKWISRKKVVQGFRYLAKTTLITRWYVAWRWLRCPMTQTKIHSSNDANAKAMAKSINMLIKELPILEHLIPSDEGVFEFNLRDQQPEQGNSLQCAGIRTSVTSSRADLYIFDDPEPDDDPESMNDRITKAMMEASHILHRPNRHQAHFQTPKMPIPELTQLIVIGQPHCANTVYFPHTSLNIHAEEQGHPLTDAKYLIIPVVDSKGEWTWPEQMNSKYYDYEEDRPQTQEEVRQQFTTENYECQMMINPQYAAGLGAALKVGEIIEQDRVLTSPFMAIDPADSSEGGCEWGAVIGGSFHGSQGHQIHLSWMGGFTGEAYEGDFDDPDDRYTLGESVWRRIFDIAEEFGVQTFILEVNLKAAQTACRRYMRKAGVSMNVIEIRAAVNKVRRIVGTLEQPVNNGMISANIEVLRDPMNRMQLTRLRYDKLPKPCDRLDAMASLVAHLIEQGPELANPFDLGHDRTMMDTSLKFPTVTSMGMPGRVLGEPI